MTDKRKHVVDQQRKNFSHQLQTMMIEKNTKTPKQHSLKRFVTL
jgi:hypothetical protein